MNRKQAGIILTLLALIICTGILANNVNKQVQDGLNDLSASNDQTTTDYFYNAMSTREKSDQQYLDNLKAIVKEENVSEEQKKAANDEIARKTMLMDYESRIELSVRSEGYEEAFCVIEGSTAKVTVKSGEDLTEEQAIKIQDIVQNITKIYMVEIERK